MNISDEAIEAAADMFERLVGVRDTLAVEKILEAAAPHLMAVAWDEGHDAAADEAPKYENPYRKSADA